MTNQIALWPPMMSTRERLRLTEVAAHLRKRSGLATLADHVPVDDRSWVLTTYGKGAFELAIRDADLAGKKVIVPAFICQDLGGIFRKYGITPVFVDVDPQTYHITPDNVPEGLAASAAGLVLLHTFGLPADGAGFRRFCDERGLVMIEDCARAFGASREGHLVGWHGDYAVFSLGKIAPVRRGGMLVSRREVEAALPEANAGLSGFLSSLLLLKVPGMKALESPIYRMVEGTPLYREKKVGFEEPPKLESPEPVVRFFFEAFLPQYAEVLRLKRDRALAMRERLEPLGFEFQADPGNHVYMALGALVPVSVDRGGLAAHLRSRAINCYTLWGDPLGTSQLAGETWGTDDRQFPVATELATRLIHFPISRFIKDSEVDRLVTACKEFLA